MFKYLSYKSIYLYVFMVLFFLPIRSAASVTTGDTNKSDILIDTVISKWTGDLDGMIKSKVIRILIVSSKTMYYIDKGKRSGIFYDLMMKFEKEINKNYKAKKKHINIHVVFIPVSRDELITALEDGKGDIAVADIAITSKRKEQIDFSDSFFHNINEIIITGPSSPEIKTLEDISGKEVFVRRSSSYWEYLEKLNQHFLETGLEPIKLKPAPEQLEDEDLMEMVNAGLIRIIVVDDYKAELWAQVFKDIVLHTDIPIKSGDDIAWMIRKKSPLLMKEINRFAKNHKEGTLFGNILLNRYVDKKKFLKNATSAKELKKFKKVVDLFRKYSNEYDLNYLLMIAQGYQESRLDQNAKSHVGAIGIMQLMPSTGKEMKVGNIRKVNANIHAGIKYHHMLINRYFSGASFNALNRTLFTFAAYNAGPARIQKIRRIAKERGLNPNIWFDNVELIVAEKIGAETTNYVANIYKYYVAYKLFEEIKVEKYKAKEVLKGLSQ